MQNDLNTVVETIHALLSEDYPDKINVTAYIINITSEDRTGMGVKCCLKYTHISYLDQLSLQNFYILRINLLYVML